MLSRIGDHSLIEEAVVAVVPAVPAVAAVPAVPAVMCPPRNYTEGTLLYLWMILIIPRL